MTWVDSCFHYKEFYPLTGKTDDTVSAVYFYLLVGVIGAGITFLSAFVSLSSTMALLSMVLNQYGKPQLVPVIRNMMLVSTVGTFVFSPFFLLFGLVSVSAFTHVFLVMVKGAPRGFSTTLRATAYAASPNLIPYVGWLWACVLIVYALAEAHQVPLWKPVAAFTIQFVVCMIVLLVPLAFIVLHILRTYHPQF